MGSTRKRVKNSDPVPRIPLDTSNKGRAVLLLPMGRRHPLFGDDPLITDLVNELARLARTAPDAVEALRRKDEENYEQNRRQMQRTQ